MKRVFHFKVVLLTTSQAVSCNTTGGHQKKYSQKNMKMKTVDEKCESVNENWQQRT